MNSLFNARELPACRRMRAGERNIKQRFPIVRRLFIEVQSAAHNDEMLARAGLYNETPPKPVTGDIRCASADIRLDDHQPDNRQHGAKGRPAECKPNAKQAVISCRQRLVR